MSLFFASGGQSIGASASASVFPMKNYSEFISFRVDWFDLFAVPESSQMMYQKFEGDLSIKSYLS